MTPKNGYVPANMLVEVEPGILLARDTAAHYLQAKSAAAADGVALSIARPAGGYRSYATQVDMHVHPGNYNLDPTSTAGLAAAGHSGHGLGNRVDINGNGRPWFLAHCAEHGFDREFGTADPGHYRFAGETWPTSGGGSSPVPAVTGWQVGQTDFKGAYGENDLNGARWYCIEPATDNSKTIWAVANDHGLTLAQTAAWTRKVATSKWAGQLLQAGSSWWDGSDRYYAGVCIALNDVAAALDTYEAQQIMAQQEAAQAAAVAAAQQDAEQTAAVQAQLNATDAAATAAVKATTDKVPAKLSQKELDAYAAKVGIIPFGSVDADPSAPLAGLFAGHSKGRARAYAAFSVAALVVSSLLPDAISSGVIPVEAVASVTQWGHLASSVLLSAGVAFGFIAASNVSK